MASRAPSGRVGPAATQCPVASSEDSTSDSQVAFSRLLEPLVEHRANVSEPRPGRGRAEGRAKGHVAGVKSRGRPAGTTTGKITGKPAPTTDFAPEGPQTAPQAGLPHCPSEEERRSVDSSHGREAHESPPERSGPVRPRSLDANGTGSVRRKRTYELAGLNGLAVLSPPALPHVCVVIAQCWGR